MLDTQVHNRPKYPDRRSASTPARTQAEYESGLLESLHATPGIPSTRFWYSGNSGNSSSDRPAESRNAASARPTRVRSRAVDGGTTAGSSAARNSANDGHAN